MPIHAIHSDPRFFPHPEAFDPSRFHPKEQAPDRFAYLPFSRGKRQCIGDRFAEMEMVLVIATLAQRYDVMLCPGQKMIPEPSVTLRPKHGIRMTVRRRQCLTPPNCEMLSPTQGGPEARHPQTCPVQVQSVQPATPHPYHRQDDS